MSLRLLLQLLEDVPPPEPPLPPEPPAPDTLLQYSITGDALTPTTEDVHVTGGTLTKHASLTALTADSTHSYLSEPNVDARPHNSATTLALAVTNNSYFYLTLTPDTGYELDLTSLTFNVARGGVSTPRGFGIRTSVDSYAADLATADITTVNPTWTAVNISLTGAAFQALTSAITFRFYVYTPEAGYSVDFDDITIGGTVHTTASEPPPVVMPGTPIGLLFLLTHTWYRLNIVSTIPHSIFGDLDDASGIVARGIIGNMDSGTGKLHRAKTGGDA